MRDRQRPSLITHSPPPFPIMNRDQISLHISIPSTLPPVHAEVRWIIRALASLRAPGWPNCWTLPSALARACNRYISQRARHLFFSIAGNLWAIWKSIHFQIFIQKMLECTQDMKQTQNRHPPMNKHTQWKKGARTWPREKIHVAFLFPAMFEGHWAGVKQTIKHYWCWGRTWGSSESVDALHRVRMIRGAWGLHHHCSFQLPHHTRPCLNMLVTITWPCLLQ